MSKLQKYEFKNGVTLKNRFVLAPMTTYSSNDDLTLSQEEESYYKSRGQQFGMVITAATAISRHAQAFPNQISIMNSDYLPSMKRLAQAIQSGGAKAILQLHHGGRMNALGLYPNQDIVSASAIKAERDNAAKPRKLTTEEVYQVIDDFQKAMKLAIEAGFDGIELHGANTYLIQQFFSPHSNQREDEFGGSLMKRLNFPIKLVEMAIDTKKKYASEKFIIGYRLSPEEIENPGISLEDTLKLVRELSSRNIDYIHFSLNSYKQTSIRNQNLEDPIINLLKTENFGNKTLIGVGGLENIEQVNEALNMGYDLVALGMAALADEKVVENIINGRQIKKTIDDSSNLPSKMRERIGNWTHITKKGYQVK